MRHHLSFHKITTLLLLIAVCLGMVTPPPVVAQQAPPARIEFKYTLIPSLTDTTIDNQAQMNVPGQPTIQSNTVCSEIGTPTTTCSTTVAPPFNAATGRQDIINKFGITLNGFDTTHLEWAWEKFWDINTTKFFTLTTGTTITATADIISRQTGCKTVELHPYNPKELFQVILLHELGHIIRNCNDRVLTLYLKHIEIYDIEKGLTYYSRNAPACTGSDKLSEDYAEFVTYYLNPNASSQSARCGGISPNPFLGGKYPLHYNLARGVLGDYNQSSPQI